MKRGHGNNNGRATARARNAPTRALSRPGPTSLTHHARPWDWLSPHTGLIPRNRIRAYCQAVAQAFRPRKIILFGSYAYGCPTPDSDVDLLVILPFRGNEVNKAIQIRSHFD